MKSEIILPLPDLKNAVSGLSKIINRKSALPVLCQVKISRTADGTVSLQGTDLEGFATYTIDGTQPGEPLDVLVPLEQLHKALKCSGGGKQDVSVVWGGDITQLRYHLAGNHPVRLCIDTALKVEGREKDAADWTKITMSEVEVSGKPNGIMLDRNYLLSALRCGLDEMYVEDDLSAMVMCKAGKRVVMMPLRPDPGPTPTATPTPTANPSAPAPPVIPSATTPAPAATPPVAEPNPAPQSSTPPKPEAEAKPEERKNQMTKTTEPTPAPAAESPFKLAMEQLDKIREHFKSGLRELSTLGDTLKLAEKDKKAGDREIEQFRDKLREIQGMKI